MMPILNPIEDDVDSLFDELERLLAPEEEEILQSLNPVTYNLYYINTSHILIKMHSISMLSKIISYFLLSTTT